MSEHRGPTTAGRHHATVPGRLFQVTPRYLPDSGGVETHVREVSKRFAAEGIDITVLTTDPTRRRRSADQDGAVAIRRVHAWPRHRDYHLAPGIWRALRRADCDLVHFQGVHTPVPAIGMLACLAARIPYVLSFHTGGHSARHRTRLRRLQWRLLAPLLRRARRLIAVSQYEKELFASVLRLHPDRIEVVRNGGGLPPAAGTTLLRTDPAQPLLVSVGRLERYKGHHRLIEALPGILAVHPRARVLILGTGPYRKNLCRLAERIGVADRVTIDYVAGADRDTYAGLLRQADLAVMLSDYEAHPVAVMEAATLGLPVLATDNSGLSELIRQGLCAGVPAAATPAQIAHAVCEQLADRHQVMPVPRLPTWDGCAAQLMSIYADASRIADAGIH